MNARVGRRVVQAVAVSGQEVSDLSALLSWAASDPERDQGVIVAGDERIVAHTRRQGRSAEAWGVALEASDVLLPLRHAMPGLSYALGVEVVHIRGWEVCP